jgi:hypothetical protein
MHARKHSKGVDWGKAKKTSAKRQEPSRPSPNHLTPDREQRPPLSRWAITAEVDPAFVYRPTNWRRRPRRRP